MDKSARLANVSLGSIGDKHVIEVSVPVGTKTRDVAKLVDLLSNELLPKLPRGCQACISGFDFWVRERFEDLVRVDLDAMQVIRG